VEDWERWWKGLEAEPGLADLFALRDAGFREAGIIWQHFDDRIVMAVR
jgi:hypothetical protein